MLKKIIKNSFLILLFLQMSCHDKQQSAIFNQMKSNYQSLKIDETYYFLKDFGWIPRTTTIGGKNYYELRCSKESYFYLGGYCRLKNDNLILFLPLNYKNEQEFNEDTLFNFSASNQDTWNLRLDYDKKVSSGDSIVFGGKYMADNDTLFKFIFYPYHYYPVSRNKHFLGHQFAVEVSQTKGPVKIFTLNGNSDTLYEAILFPKEKFINKLGNKLLL